MSNNLSLVVNKTNLPCLVEENGLVSYLEQIKKFPLLKPEQELELLKSYKEDGNIDAAHQLTTSHLRLAAKIAFNYRHYGLPIADIISEANIGLMQAIKSFDISKAVRLSTYAIWWIKAAINDYILRSWSLVKIGTKAAQKKLFYNLSKIKARLGLYENHSLTPSQTNQIARELVVEPQDVIEMNSRIYGDTSLNVCIGDDEEYEKIDLLVDSSQNLEARLSAKQEKKQKNQIISQALAQLKDREQYVIKNRMLTEDIMTLEDIGAYLGVTRERVRQIEQKAFEKLSQIIKNNI